MKPGLKMSPWPLFLTTYQPFSESQIRQKPYSPKVTHLFSVHYKPGLESPICYHITSISYKLQRK